jgi:hypothetical protein
MTPETIAARRADKRPLRLIIADAMHDHGADARAADTLWRSWCTHPVPRVPGCDTVYRLAVRLWVGRSIEDAAKEEYLYRWRLALQSRMFGVPHTLGL